MKRLFAFLLLITITCAHSLAQDLPSYQPVVWIKGTDTLRLRMQLPENFDSSKQYPLVLFLHGAGERGADNNLQLMHGAKLFADAAVRQQFPAIVVFPQCAANDFWSNVEIGFDEKTKQRNFAFQEAGNATPALNNVINWLQGYLNEMHVDRQRVYVMGLSMGGMGTFEIVRRMPNTFAAAVAICGGANTATAKQIRKTPFWIFHAADDPIVPASLSQDMIMALQQFYDAADMQFTMYPKGGHNSWDKAFAEKDFLPWVFSFKLASVKVKQ